MADWSVTPQPLSGINTLGWWVDVPAVVAESVTGWWEVTAQLVVPSLVGSATALMRPPAVTAGARPVSEAFIATAAMTAPTLVVTVTVPAVMSATAAMPAPAVGGAALVTATLMTATAAPKAPGYNLNYGGGGGGFPYTFDFALDAGLVPETFDYTFDFALG